MARVWMLPIEPLKLRYSGQWLVWWSEGLKELGWDVHTVHADGVVDDAIGTGQFLDAYNTHVYKAWQIQQVGQALARGQVRDGDWVFLHDGWNPAVTALSYMRAVGRAKFKLCAFLHAGTWDPHDHLVRCGLTREMRGAEQSWLESLDLIFMATRFHCDLVCDALGEKYRAKMRVVGLPLYYDALSSHATEWEQRPARVVFPHRLAPEKQPEQFALLQKAYEARYPGDCVEWVTTADRVKTMAEYYDVLGSSRVAFSAALQETFGIAMQEATMLGCHPVVPDRLSFAELFGAGSRYRALEQAVELVRAGVHAGTGCPADPRRWEGVVEEASGLMLRGG